MFVQPGFYPSPTTQMAQQRLQAMEAQYPQFANPMPMAYQQGPMYQGGQPAPPPNPVIKGRPVSNEEEANAAMIDFDGSLFIFPDKAHNKIYTKQLGLDGNIVFNVYSRVGDAQPDEKPKAPAEQFDLSGYAKVSDVEKALSILQDKILKLEQQITNGTDKGGNK